MVRGYSTDALHFQCAISDNTIVLLVCPPKFCISIVFVFSWDHFKSQEKLQTMLMQNLGGQTKSIMVFFEVAYIFFAIMHYILISEICHQRNYWRITAPFCTQRIHHFNYAI